MIKARPVFVEFYANSNTQLPALTRMLLSIPTWMTLLLSILALALLIKKGLSPNKKSAVIINVVVLLFLILCVIIFIAAFYLPLFPFACKAVD